MNYSCLCSRCAPVHISVSFVRQGNGQKCQRQSFSHFNRTGSKISAKTFWMSDIPQHKSSCFESASWMPPLVSYSPLLLCQMSSFPSPSQIFHLLSRMSSSIQQLTLMVSNNSTACIIKFLPTAMHLQMDLVTEQTSQNAGSKTLRECRRVPLSDLWEE